VASCNVSAAAGSVYFKVTEGNLVYLAAPSSGLWYFEWYENFLR